MKTWENLEIGDKVYLYNNKTSEIEDTWTISKIDREESNWAAKYIRIDVRFNDDEDPMHWLHENMNASECRYYKDHTLKFNKNQ